MKVNSVHVLMVPHVAVVVLHDLNALRMIAALLLVDVSLLYIINLCHFNFFRKAMTNVIVLPPAFMTSVGILFRMAMTSVIVLPPAFMTSVGILFRMTMTSVIVLTPAFMICV